MRAFCMMLMAWILAGCAAVPGAGSQGDPAPVVAATSAWREAYDSRDAARIVALYDQDAVLWGTRAKQIAATPAAILDYFKDAASRPTARVAIQEQYARIYGDVGVNSGHYTFSEVRNGVAISRPARFTLVFRNRDGAWRIVAHHSSEVP